MIKASIPPLTEKPVGAVLTALIGPLMMWALHFSVVFGAHHLICGMPAFNFSGSLMLTVVGVATIAVLLALLLLIVKPYVVPCRDGDETAPKNSQSFLTGIMRLVALLSFFGVLWTVSAIFFLPVCKALA